MRKKRFTAFLLSLAMAGTSLYTCSVIDVQAAAVEQEAENPNLEQLAEIQEQAAVVEQVIEPEVQAQAVEEEAAPEEQAGDITSPISLKGVTQNGDVLETNWKTKVEITDDKQNYQYDFQVLKDGNTISSGSNVTAIQLRKEDFGGVLSVNKVGAESTSVNIQIKSVAPTASLLSFEDATVSTNGVSYNSKFQEPVIIVSDGEKFGQGVAYNITYRDNKEVGIATAVLEFDNSKCPYQGTITKTFQIKTNEIKGVSVNVPGKGFHRYTGQKQDPAKDTLTVTESGNSEVVLQPEDYNITWDNTENVGSASANVTLTGYGKRFPANTVFKLNNVFEISANNTAVFTPSFKGDKATYEIGTSVNEISENVIVKVGDSIVSTDDYEVVSVDGKTVSGGHKFDESGEHKLQIVGTRNYDGAKVKAELPFTIIGIKVSEDAIKVSYNNNIVYDGTEKELPQLTVSVDGTVSGLPVSQDGMKEGQDFRVDYKNNVNAGSISDKQAPTAVITLISGNYAGSTKTVSFNIAQADLNTNISAKPKETKFTYDGGSHVPEVDLTKKSSTAHYEITKDDYKVVISKNGTGNGTVSGDYWCIVSANVSGNYKGKIEHIKCEILRKSISDNDITGFDVDGKTYGYTGSAVIPELSLKYENSQSANKFLTKDTDYIVKGNNNVDKGDNATIVVTGKGNYCGTLKATFSIGDSGFTSVRVSTNNQLSYRGKVLSAADLAPMTKVYSDGKEVSTNYYTISVGDVKDVGTYTMTIVGKGFYSNATPYTHKFTVVPRAFNENNVTVISTAAYRYKGGQTAAPTAKISDNDLSGAEALLKEGIDYRIEKINDKSCRIIGMGNYTTTIITKPYSTEPTNLSEVAEVSSDAAFVYNTREQKIDPAKLKIRDALHNVDLAYREDFITGPIPSTTQAGTVDMLIKGYDNYTGETTISINVAPMDIASDEVKQISENGYATSVNYTGVSVDYVAPASLTKNCLSFNDDILNGKNMDYDVKLRIDGKLTDSYQNVGVYDIVAVGKGNYSGVRVLGTLTVNAIQLKPENFRLSETRFEYKEGSVPNVTVIPTIANLLQDRDYTVEYAENPGERGTHTITVTGKGNYAGTVELTYVVGPITLSEGNTVIYYAGTESDNALVQVTAEGKALVPDKDYEVVSVVAKAGTDPKAWDVTIKGIGAYEGTFTQEVKEGAITILETNVSVTGNFTYNGQAQAPAASDVKVTVAGRVLSENTDYTVAIPNDSVDAGSYAVTVVGTGAYTGTVQAAYEIKAIAFTEADVKVESEVEYAGSTVTPPITITVDGKELVLGTDYIVESDDDMENVGKKTVTITGIGNYANTAPIEKTFTIVAASLANAKVNVYSPEYTGAAQTAKVTSVVMNNRIILKAGVDYTVETKKATNAGTVKVTVTGKGNYKGTATGNFVIRKKDIAKASVTNIQDKTYTGKAVGQTSALKVVVNKKRLTKDKEYTVSYSKNKAIGKANFRIKGKGNYTGTTSAYSFRIFPKKATIAKLTAGSKRFTIQTKKLGGGVKYQIQYRVKGSKAGYTRVETKNYKKVIKGLRKGKTYTVKVRAYKKIKEGNTWKMYYGAFSKAKNVKVK